MKTIRKTLTTAFLAVLCTAAIWATTSPEAEKDAMIADWERAKAYTLEYIDAMPEASFFKSPTEGIRTFAAQMLHIGDGNAGIISIGTGAQGPFKGGLEQDASLTTKAKVREAVVKSYDFAIEALKNWDLSKANEEVQSFGQNLPRIEWVKKAFEHQTHHRGQTTIYLRMEGVAPPPEKLF